MSKLFDYLTNSPSATPVNASFEVQASETPVQAAPQPVAPVSAATKPKKFKRIGKKLNRPAVSAQGKNLTVVASSVQRPQKPKTPVKTFFKNRLNVAADAKKVGAGIKKVATSKFVKKAAPFAAGAMLAMPVAAGAMLAIKNRKAIGAGIKKVATGNFVKKTAPIAAIAAGAPIVAGALLLKKGGAKKVAAGAKKVLKKIKIGRRR